MIAFFNMIITKKEKNNKIKKSPLKNLKLKMCIVAKTTSKTTIDKYNTIFSTKDGNM